METEVSFHNQICNTFDYMVISHSIEQSSNCLPCLDNNAHSIPWNISSSCRFEATELLDECHKLVDLFKSQTLSSDQSAQKSLTDLWQKVDPLQRELALKWVMDKAPVDHANLTAVDACLELSKQENCEIRFL